MNEPWYLADTLAFASHDNLIFPVRNKRPLVEWTKDATDDPGIIEAWWRQYGHPDFAWAVPKGVVIVDIDDRKAFDAAQLDLPKTAMQGTPRGEHWVYQSNGHAIEQRTKVAPGTDLRVGGKGYVVLYDPRRLLANRAEVPQWVAGNEATPAVGAPRQLSSDVMGTRDDVLLSLGTIASSGKGFSVDVYRGMLESWRAKGALVALDPSRPWTDDDLGEFAEQAEEWDRKAVKDRAWGQALRESLAKTRQEPQPAEWPAPPGEAAYMGLAGDVVAAIAEHTEADPIGLVVSMLIVYGAMVGHGGHIHAGKWQHGNLFMVQCGPTNDGRKGTTFDNISEVWDVAEPGWRDQLIVAGLGSGEGLIKHLTKQGSGLPKALVYETEFARLLNAMSWSGSTLSPILRAGWDGSGLGRAVASSAVMVYDHHISLLGNITESELRMLLTGSDQANGFANRFMWIATRRQRLLPETRLLGPLIEQYRPFLRAALDFGREDRQFQWGDDAIERWREFYGQKIGFGLWQAMTSRRQPMVVRLALIQAMLNRTTKGSMGLITLPILESAIALVEYSERTVSYLFKNSTGNRNSDALLDMLRREGGEVKWMDARNEIGVRGAADMNEVVDVLAREGMVNISTVQRPGGGRPTRLIKLTKKMLDA